MYSIPKTFYLFKNYKKNSLLKTFTISRNGCLFESYFTTYTVKPH